MKPIPIKIQADAIRLLIQYHILELRFWDKALQRLKHPPAVPHKTTTPKSWPAYRGHHFHN